MTQRRPGQKLRMLVGNCLLEINPKVKLFLPFDRTIGGRPTNNDQDEEWNKN